MHHDETSTTCNSYMHNVEYIAAKQCPAMLWTVCQRQKALRLAQHVVALTWRWQLRGRSSNMRAISTASIAVDAHNNTASAEHDTTPLQCVLHRTCSKRTAALACTVCTTAFQITHADLLGPPLTIPAVKAASMAVRVRCRTASSEH
eukprot:4817-Heterococcus_DN1.PRE.2